MSPDPALAAGSAGLEARRLGLSSSPGRRPRLAGVDFAVRPGRVAALVGPNGSGKTSLIACLAGLERPDTGRVSLDGRPLSSLGRARLARQVAWAGALPFPDVGLTVRELVTLGRLAHRANVWEDPARGSEADVEAALAAMDLVHLDDAPLGTLSAGERQRARLAAAWAQGARYLLLDEPTAALDPGHARRVLELARAQARSGAGVVLALHDLTAAAQYADDLTLLAEGRVVASGDPWRVLEASVLERVYATPLRVFAHPDTGRPVVLPGYPPAGAPT
ncbi:MAG: ABC transporter ATP-binding protein [Firmicutes bacterium]|nr:ABC transporter ATP-binding protein [Bacillota bacterium]